MGGSEYKSMEGVSPLKRVSLLSKNCDLQLLVETSLSQPHMEEARRINILTIPSSYPLVSCWGASLTNPTGNHWPTQLEAIGLTNWKQLANLTGSPRTKKSPASVHTGQHPASLVHRVE